MNRSQLFNDAWKYMIGNRALWLVALIGTGISAAASLILYGESVIPAFFNAAIGLVAMSFSAGALITMINGIAEGQKPTLNDGVQSGLQNIIPLILLRLVLMVPIWIIAFILTGSLVQALSGAFGRPGGLQSATTNLTGATVGLSVVALLILAILSVAVSGISVGAERALVLEKRPILDALKYGWNLLTTRLGDFLVIGGLMILVGIGIGLAFGCMVSALVVPMAITSVTTSSGGLASASFGVTAVVSTLGGAIIGVVTEVLFSGVWTLAYRKWQGK